MEKNFFDKKDYNSRILESENFIVVPSLGSLVPGWLLIVPKEFSINLSQLSENYLSELEAVVLDIQRKFLPTFNDEYVLFEHGPSSKNSKAGCGVDYAHLHFVPVSFDLKQGISTFLDFDYSWSELASIKDIRNLQNYGQDYLYLRDQSGKHFITLQDNIPSQTFRKIIAHNLGIPQHFDWKSNHGLENIATTLERLVL